MFVLNVHSGPVYSVVFSPDGNSLVTSSADSTVKITDLNASEEVRSFPGSPYCCPIACSPDGRFVARGGRGIVVWTVLDRAAEPLIALDQWYAEALAFSPDGRVLAAQGSNRPLRRWSIPSGVTLPGGWGGAREGNQGAQFPTGSLAYSPDGTVLATSFGVRGERGFDSVIRLWEADSGQLQGEVRADFTHSHPTAILFSPDGQLLAGIHGPVLRLFDVPSRKEVARIKPGSKHFKGLVFTPDGRKLVTVSNDKIARVWSVPTLSEEKGFAWKIGKLTASAIARDGMRIAAGSDSGKVIVWDVDA